MQNKKEKFLDKIVKKDYSNELEKILEKKNFDENAKNLLLSILYKVQMGYKDYELVKQNTQSKEEYIKTIIKNIEKNCESIKLIEPNSKESQNLGKKTFLVDQKSKVIICYPIERKLLYCISKIGKKDKIVKGVDDLINITLTDLLNTGNNINTVEPMRDFNGYSWTTITREIESLEHNLIYQNLVILLGSKLFSKWVVNKEYIMNYTEIFENKLEEQYGKENKELIKNILIKLSILLSMKFNYSIKNRIKKEKKENDKLVEQISDNKKFVQEITIQKKELTARIKDIDETITDKIKLQKEYMKRNENLELEQKIFSVRILSGLMAEEREKIVKQIEELNIIINPQKFLKYKNEIKTKEKYFEVVDEENQEMQIKRLVIKLQKIFLECFKIKINKIQNKNELMKLIYEFRYYSLNPFGDSTIGQTKEIQKELKEVQMLILKEAHKLKLIETIADNEEIEYEILKNIFNTRNINLEEINIKLTKEKDTLYIQIVSEGEYEEKFEIEDLENINKKDLKIKLNKKVKVFKLS